MHDLPTQVLLQQAHARPVSGEELEVMGKNAAARYSTGACSTLSEAVVETVKRAGLSPEQVRRVVEFANQGAYQTEFKKESSSHKYVEFHGGPADPAEVLQDLNDGGGGTVFDRGLADYSTPPPSLEKAAALHERNIRALGLEKTAAAEGLDAELREAFAVEDPAIPYANPLQDSEMMAEKLAAARDSLSADISFLETDHLMTSGRLLGEVKQAALDGVPLGHIIQAWQSVTPGPGFVKAAFTRIGPQLVEQGVFDSLDSVGASLTKTAGDYLVPNPDHPIVQHFSAFCDQLTKLAEARVAREEVEDYLQRIERFMQKVAAGAVGKLWDFAGRSGAAISKPVGRAAKALGGEGAEEVAAGLAKRAPQAALVGGGLMAADSAYDHLKYSPVGQAGRAVWSHVPGTNASRMREAMIAQRYGAFY